jgi:hypothetical protein
MDPYLEHRYLWPDVHHSLITGIRRALAPQVAPAYYVAVEERTYIVASDRQQFVGQPDVAIIAPLSSKEPSTGGVATAVATPPLTVSLPLYERVSEAYLEIREAQTHAVITAIEVLSPTNKISYEGRQEYETKRRQVLATVTSLVEIDLLRAGEPMEMEPLPKSDYRVLVGCGWARPQARLYAFNLRQALPVVPVPLSEGEQEAQLPLGQLLAELYDEARYDLRVDYRSVPPEPPLSPDDATWLAELLREKGPRA